MMKKYIRLWSWILNKIEIVIIILQYIKIIIQEMTDSFDNYSEISDAKMEKNKKDKEKRQKAYDEYLKFYGDEIINKFISEMIVKTDNKKDIIKKQQLSAEFKFRLHRETPKIKMPKNQDLYDRMDKQFKTQRANCWEGVKFNNYSISGSVELDKIDEIDELSML